MSSVQNFYYSGYCLVFRNQEMLNGRPKLLPEFILGLSLSCGCCHNDTSLRFYRNVGGGGCYCKEFVKGEGLPLLKICFYVREAGETGGTGRLGVVPADTTFVYPQNATLSS